MKSGSWLTLADGSRVELGALVAKAGEGSVYEVVGQPDSVIKVFHPTLADLPAKLDKVAAMAATPPRGAVQSDEFAVLTWPQRVVLDASRPVGYLMARADTATAVEIHAVSNPSNRAKPLPGSPQWTTEASWAHLVNIAANLCLAVQVVHRVDAVIGDFQERNILVSDTTRVTLVDCDSMQFTGGDGRQFLCGVARPEFTAPEVAALNLRTEAREQPSDYFALAVHIYLLLMGGNHPFMRGAWKGAGEQPSALELARTGDWAGGPRSRLQTHPLAPPPSFLPPDVQTLFEKAFAHGATDPRRRPSAERWRKALLRVTFTTCTGPYAHQIPVGCVHCPWCDIDNERRNRRQEAEDLPDQVIFTVPKSARTQTPISRGAQAPSPIRSQPAPARVAGARQAAAQAKSPASKARTAPPKSGSGLSAPPADHVSSGQNFAFIGISIFFLVAMVCAVLVLGGFSAQINTSPASVDTAPESKRPQPTFLPIGPGAGAAPVRVYSVSDQAGAADRVAAQLRDGGWTVAEVKTLPWPQVNANYSTTVYFSDSPDEQETAKSVGRALHAPVEPRGPEIADLGPGVIVVVVQ